MAFREVARRLTCALYSTLNTIVMSYDTRL